MTKLRALLQNSDLFLAFGVAGLVAMLVVPLPTVLLDALLATNLTTSVLILAVTLFARNALAVSTFPTVLLLTTLFRLGLNLSTTRLILTTGHGGEVVRAFGTFVVGGDLVVGLVMFLVLTLVQFLVIAKGAERVAEVAARFTLDAMPGKQMSIDAALRAGSLSEQEAEQRRLDLGRESQLFGSMDGAMKFIKGDAIAGLVITALNLVAGMLIGVVRLGMSMGEAAETYSILSVGDAIVSQIPALLITLSAGLVTTRVAPAEKGLALGGALGGELFGNPLVLLVTGVLALALAAVPGLPLLPFGLLATALIAAFVVSHRRAEARAEAKARSDAENTARFRDKLSTEAQKGKALRSVFDDEGPIVAPIALEISHGASAVLRGLGDANESLRRAGNDARNRIFTAHGVQLPGFSFRLDAALPGRAVMVRLRDVPVFVFELPRHPLIAVADPDRLTRLGIEAEAFEHAVIPMRFAAVPASERQLLESAGILLQPLADFLLEFSLRAVREDLASFLGLEEVSQLLTRLETVAPTLVREVVPKHIALPQLVEVLRQLVEEHVSIRDLRSILGALAEVAPTTQHVPELVEYVRAALASQIGFKHAPGDVMRVIQLDPALEDTLESALERTRTGQVVLALEPELVGGVQDRASALSRQAASTGHSVVFLCRPSLRRAFWELLRPVVPHPAVLSYGEVPAKVHTPVVGRIGLGRALAA